jgi:hypothetical protein
MKQTLKKQILAVALSGAMLGTGVLAQDTQTPNQQDTPTQGQDNGTQGPGGHHGGFGGHHDGPGGQGMGEHGGSGMGAMGGHGMGGMPFGRVALGTKLSFTFYDGDPTNGGKELSTLEFTNGTDSESAFAEKVQTAKADAAYMVVNTSEQTRTLELNQADSDGRGPRLPLGHLNDGSTLTATFYNGDPANGGTVVETLSFTQGTSSESGFANDFAKAAATATFVAVTTSPQTQTIDLSASGFERFGPDRPQ